MKVELNYYSYLTWFKIEVQQVEYMDLPWERLCDRCYTSLCNLSLNTHHVLKGGLLISAPEVNVC